MKINSFKLERYFAEHEFKARYLLSPSDCECFSIKYLLSLADAEMRAAWETLTLGYTESPGHHLLRTEVARIYEQIKADEVLITIPEEAIFIAVQALLSPGDHAIVTFPSYQSLYELARSKGCNVTLWTLEAAVDGWRLDLQFLDDHITPSTRLLIINFPHNPTGFLPSREDFYAILDLARRKNLYVLSDEMYRLLEYDETSKLPSACDLYENAITLSGLSKNMGLPGLRVGWLATRNKSLMSTFINIKDYTTICGSAPSEILAIIALRAKDTLIERNLGIVRDNLAAADDFFRHFSSFFNWLHPCAGSVAFPSLISGMSIDQFCRNLLDREKVMVVPGSLFEFPGDHFRIGLGRKNFRDALQHVGKYLKSI